jgi:REP element-mobilizing transposase RayT
MSEAKRLIQKVYAVAVCSNHVHLVLGYDKRAIGELVRSYKNEAYFALRKNGFVKRVWTRGYDKRYCFDEKSLKDRIDYVLRHD